MKTLDSKKGLHAHKSRIALLRDEWERNPDETAMWSPLYGDVRVKGVGEDGVRFVDGRGHEHSVDADLRARVSEDVATAEEMLRPDRDRSIRWDWLGAEYIELSTADGEREEGFRRSVSRWTGGGVAYDSAGMDALWENARPASDDDAALLVASSRTDGTWHLLRPWDEDDLAACDWVRGHCRKADRGAGASPVWRCEVELSKVFAVLVDADSRDLAYQRLRGMRDRLPGLLERNATGWDCEPEVSVDVIRETDRRHDPEVQPDWDMDLEEALKEEGE